MFNTKAGNSRQGLPDHEAQDFAPIEGDSAQDVAQWAKVTQSAMASNVSPIAFRVFCELISHSKNLQTQISHKHLASLTGSQDRSVRRATKELAERGLVSVLTPYSGARHNKPVYQIIISQSEKFGRLPVADVRNPALQGCLKVLSYALMRAGDEEKAWFSNREVRDATGMSESTVKRQLNALAEAGRLSRVRENGKQYRYRIPRKDPGHFGPAHPGHFGPALNNRPSSLLDPALGSGASARSCELPHITDAMIDEVYSYLKALQQKHWHINLNLAPISNASLRTLIRDRLKANGLQACKQVIAMIDRDQYLNGSAENSHVFDGRNFDLKAIPLLSLKSDVFERILSGELRDRRLFRNALGSECRSSPQADDLAERLWQHIEFVAVEHIDDSLSSWDCDVPLSAVANCIEEIGPEFVERALEHWQDNPHVPAMFDQGHRTEIFRLSHFGICPDRLECVLEAASSAA